MAEISSIERKDFFFNCKRKIVKRKKITKIKRNKEKDNEEQKKPI